jgi:RNA polymerase sigma-70 factor (family 1)
LWQPTFECLKDLTLKPPKQIWPDDILVEQLQNGNIDALGTIYHKYSALLYQTLYNLIRNRQVCEDLIHDLFIDLWQRRQHHNIKQLKPYLYIAARNRVLMLARNGKIIIDVHSLELAGSQHEPESAVLSKELNSIVNRQLEKLPNQCREIYTLSRIEQRSHKEIASLKNISIKTVENQITIALKRLRPALKDFLLLIALLNLGIK